MSLTGVCECVIVVWMDVCMDRWERLAGRTRRGGQGKLVVHHHKRASERASE